MTALSAVTTRPLCAPPYHAPSSMSERRFKHDDHAYDAHDAHDTSRHRRRHAPLTDGQDEWRRPAPATDTRSGSSNPQRREDRRLPLPPAPHSLRHGSTFPYVTVPVATDRHRESSADHREPYVPRPTWQHVRDPHVQHQQRQQLQHQHQRQRQHQQQQQQQQQPSLGRADLEAPSRRVASIQYLVDEQRRSADERAERVGAVVRDQRQWQDDRWLREGSPVLERRGPMPSLGALLQRSYPAGEQDRDRRGRDERPDDMDRQSDHPYERQGRAHASYDHPVLLPSLQRLSSLTERHSSSSLSEYSSSPVRGSPQTTYRPSSLIAATRTAAVPARRDIQPTVSHQRRSEDYYEHARAAAHCPQLSRPVSRAPVRSVPADVAATLSAMTTSTASPLKRLRAASDDNVGSGADTAEEAAAADDTGAAGAAPARKKKKRKVRICTTPGCDKLVVDHGVCIRHGGGKRCNVEGCDCRAQNKGLCWKHGGYTICQVEGCDKRAKSRGMCWSHGGGTQCKTDGCEKIAVSRGRCWAHGGGKRCKLPDCQKPAALRMDDFCTEHYTAHRATLASAQASSRLDTEPRTRYTSW